MSERGRVTISVESVANVPADFIKSAIEKALAGFMGLRPEDVALENGTIRASFDPCLTNNFVKLRYRYAVWHEATIDGEPADPVKYGYSQGSEPFHAEPIASCRMCNSLLRGPRMNANGVCDKPECQDAYARAEAEAPNK